MHFASLLAMVAGMALADQDFKISNANAEQGMMFADDPALAKRDLSSKVGLTPDDRLYFKSDIYQ